MLWLGRHPIPSLPPPWQMLFPGMLEVSKENAKLRALGSSHLDQTSLTEGNRDQSDPVVNSEPRKHIREERNAFPAAEAGTSILRSPGAMGHTTGAGPQPSAEPGIPPHSKDYLKGRGPPGKTTTSFWLHIAVPKHEAFSLQPWKQMSFWAERWVLVTYVT